MNVKNLIIGIDAGSVALGVVEMNIEGEILGRHYVYHQGKPVDCLIKILEKINWSQVAGVARTSDAPEIFESSRVFDTRVSVIQGAKAYKPDLKSILHVGGEKFNLFEFDDDGTYQNMKSNTSCAAGTGGFLDQQAKRLNLGGSADLSAEAQKNQGVPPKIASRCSVFAKTDIIHAQQEGFSLQEICDGLCMGLANNLAETLFSGNQNLNPMVFSGGVARNKAVKEHLETLLEHPLLVSDDAPLFGAIGAGLILLEEGLGLNLEFSLDGLNIDGETQKEYCYDPLELKLSDYPDFDSWEHFDFTTDKDQVVEVDVYQNLDPGSYAVSFGIDVGSTSTKAVIIDDENQPILGLYTRTAGRPIPATQSILEACGTIAAQRQLELKFIAAGSTGSGRKFVGKIIGVDTILDEISAHARAAVDLCPDIDTIIEIGGQDSKFTTLKDGMVTFSQMNTVCAAGTGSFIEEQAQKLGVSLAEYADMAQGARAPLSSDRCTVFMERDINHYLNKNYTVPEILATVLFSVRENYLQKVATQGNMGEKIFFQGATAKNRALVAAFEQKMNKPILVSRYCHLTGALGAAITAMEEGHGQTSFKGIDLYRQEIPVRSESCDLCLNHCRIRVASVMGSEVAYGFLCGRDYKTKKFIKKQKAAELLQSRQKTLAPLAIKRKAPPKGDVFRGLPVVGIPAGLHIFEELPLWKKFFHSLEITTISTEVEENVIARGKKLSGAEFCAPMSAFYGHVAAAAERSDLVFLPIQLANGKEEENPTRLRKFCYYTQFSSTLTSKIEIDGQEIQSLRPLIDYRANIFATKLELQKSLNSGLPRKFSFLEVSRAFDDAIKYYDQTKKLLKSLYKAPKKGEPKVVLLGRPYTVLQKSMNKDIPEFFATQGIETLFYDSLPDREASKSLETLLDLFHWAYPAAILTAAEVCAQTDGLYPVYVTSFKCSPDSFSLEYFKRIMEEAGKPYLILQIDDHDSNVGYETRIEAGIRAFKNHLNSDSSSLKKQESLPVAPEIVPSLKGKTVVLPNWDPFVLPLVAANLEYAGIDVRVMNETSAAIASSMKMNTGQCIPVSAVAREYAALIRDENLDPEKTVLWMIKSVWSCNIPMYPSFIKSILEKEGADLSKAGVYSGELTMVDISPIVAIKTYFAYMFGGNLKKIGCKIRPYEVNKGETDRVLIECRDLFISAFHGELTYKEAMKIVIVKIDKIEYHKTDRPKVALFGDLYVRDNDVMNQNLVRTIEEAGGEVILTAYHDYMKIISGALFKRWRKQLNLSGVVIFKSLLAAMEVLEGRYHNYLGKYIGKPISSKNPTAEEDLAKFHIRIEQEGESYENILKILHLMKEHPDLSLFIQTNPAFCCPSMVTDAMAGDIEAATGVPVLSITYDGTEAPKNDVIIPYLKFARGKGPVKTSNPFKRRA